MSQNKSRFILAIQIAGQLNAGNALKGIERGWFSLGLALGLFTLLAPAIWWMQSHTHTDDGDKSANSHSLSQQEGDPQKVNKSVESVAVGNLESRNHPDHEKYYNHQDLKAQESVAKSTLAIEDYTFRTWVSSLILGFLGLIGIGWTIAETRKGNATARKIGQVQARAYLTITGGTFEFVDDGYAGTITVKNVGNSPAFNVIGKHNLINIGDGPNRPEMLRGFAYPLSVGAIR